MREKNLNISIRNIRSFKKTILAIEALGVDELADWIYKRLHGHDPYYPLYTDGAHGEDDPCQIFAFVVAQSVDEAFVVRMYSAIAQLLKEFLADQWDSKPELERQFFIDLLILIEQLHPKDNMLHVSIYGELTEILFRLAERGEFKDQRLKTGVLVQWRILFALRKCQSEDDFKSTRDFWLQSFDAGYCAPAFDTFCTWDPEFAISLLPGLLRYNLANKKRHGITFSLLKMYRHRQKWTSEKWNALILSAFSGNYDSEEWRALCSIFERHKIPVPTLPV